ncbi:hypothetical protein Tco_1061315 [Tanacetum coccineum]
MGLRCVSSVRGLRSVLQAIDPDLQIQTATFPSIMDPWIVCTSHLPMSASGIASVDKWGARGCQGYGLLEAY